MSSTTLGPTSAVGHVSYISHQMVRRPRPKTVAVTYGGTSKSWSFSDPNTQSPLLFRRSATTISGVPRIKSASLGPIAMPRSHVSVARFYDWSEDIGGCFSVSQLYREMAAIPSLMPERIPRFHGSVDHATTSRHVTSGRMFVRDKKTLTRGEREIIEGIYKNRGDVTGRDVTPKMEHQVKSHHDAWLTDRSPRGTNLHRVLVKGEKIDGRPFKVYPNLDTNFFNTSSASDTSKPESPESVHLRTLANRQHHDTSAYFINSKAQDEEGLRQSREPGPAAPPCSPNDSNPHSGIHVVHTFDKLLTLRQSLPTNSIVFADRFTSAIHVDHSQSANQMHASCPRDVTSPKTKMESVPLFKSHLEAGNGTGRHKMSHVTKTLHSQLLSMEDYNKMCGTAQWLLNNGDDVGGDQPVSGQEVRDVKKLSVQVFIPTAEHDVTGEEDSSTTTSMLLSRERPLSHRTFKAKQNKPDMTNICVGRL